MKKIALLFISTMLTGCTFILTHVIYQVHKPKVETNSTIGKFAVQNSIERNDVYIIDSLYYPSSYTYFAARLANIRIYNHSGDLLKVLEQNECSSGLEPLLQKLDRSFINEHTLQNVLDTDLKKIKRLDGHTISFKELEEYDYLIMIVWAKFTGKRFFRETVLDWTKKIKVNTTAKIKVIYLNADLNENWGTPIIK